MNHVLELVLALFAMVLSGSMLVAVVLWDWREGTASRTTESSSTRDGSRR